jgi:hypothetical protein
LGIGRAGGGGYVSRNFNSDNRTLKGTSVTGFFGVSRDNSSDFEYLIGTDAIDTEVISSQAGHADNFFIFTDSAQGTSSDARLSFYSIGNATDLELMRSRVSLFIDQIANEID